MSDALIEFDEITVRFGQVTAVTDFTQQVMPGEFVSLVGPSGCGKSTILRLTSGLINATAGEVKCHTDKIGYVFQDATLMPWRTVRKNVELLGELEKLDPKVRSARADEVLELVGLTEFEDNYPLELSGGMKMRTSLARSLLLEPDLFLFDEPFGALDQISRGRLNEELINLYADKRFASIFVTHSVEEAVFLSQRVVVMSARPGRVVAEFEVPFGYPREPSMRFEAEFGALASDVADALEQGS